MVSDGVNSPEGFSLRFWTVITATLLGFVGIGSVLPALAPHVRHDLGGTDRTVGFVIGTFSFVALGSRFFCGPLADRKGRKITFQAGLLSCAAAGAAYLLPLGLPGAFFGRILQGFGEACLYTGAAAWVVELGGISRAGQALGYLSSAIWGGLSAGPAVGHWLGSFNNAALFQLCSALAGVLITLSVQEGFRHSAEGKGGRFPLRELLMPGLALGFVNVHYPVIAGFLVLHLSLYGNSGASAFSAYAGVMLLSRFFFGSLPDRMHPASPFYGGIAFMALGLLALGFHPWPWYVAITAAGLLGFGYSFPFSSLAATVLRRTPNESHGAVVGVLGAYYDIFLGFSSLEAGVVADRFGYSAAFAIAAIALIAAAIAGYKVFFTNVDSKQEHSIPESDCIHTAG